MNHTSCHSRAHVTSVCFWQPMWEVVCLWAVPQCNLWTCTPTKPVYHWLIWQLEFTNLIKCWLWAIWGVNNDELMMSCTIRWFLSMRLVRWEGNQSTTSITLWITRDWGWCNQDSCLWWMPGSYRMYGDSSLVEIGESSFKIDLYFIHYDLQTLYTSKRI